MISDKKRFAVFDIDGTIIRWQLYHAIVSELARRGVLPSEVTERIHRARLTWQQRQENDSFVAYENVLVNEFHQALPKIRVAAFGAAVDEVFEHYKDQVYTYTRELVKELKQDGYMLLAISGSQQEITKKFGHYYGFDEVIGSDYKNADGVFTGERIIPGYHIPKGELLQQLVTRLNLEWKDSIGVGDTRGDISMLALVERPIAFNPSKDLLEEATKNRWEVVIERKNVAYELLPTDSGEYVLKMPAIQLSDR